MGVITCDLYDFFYIYMYEEMIWVFFGA